MSKPIPKGTPITGDMTKALDSRFLNSIVLQGALDKTGKTFLPITIDRVEHLDTIEYENGRTDSDLYLLYFKGSDKPLKLAITNIKRIINMHGTIGEGWHGKQINLCLEEEYRPDIKMKGPCVRVKVEARRGF